MLRQRLEEYFEHEAPSSPLIITIPKGGYVPVFEPRHPRSTVPIEESSLAPPETAVAAIPQVEMNEVEIASHPRWGRVWAAAGLVVLLLAAAIGVWFAIHTGRSASDVLWTTIFKEDRPVVIVPSDDGLVLFEEQSKTPILLDEYLSGSYLDRPDLGNLGQLRLSHQER